MRGWVYIAENSQKISQGNVYQRKCKKLLFLGGGGVNLDNLLTGMASGSFQNAIFKVFHFLIKCYSQKFSYNV